MFLLGQNFCDTYTVDVGAAAVEYSHACTTPLCFAIELEMRSGVRGSVL